MFFSLGWTKHKQFSHYYDLPNGMILSTDSGWKIFKDKDQTIIAKGYANTSSLDQVIQSSSKGNYCAWIVDDNNASLEHDTVRSFPLYVHNDNSITNLMPSEKQVWADKKVTINKKNKILQVDINTPIFDGRILDDKTVVNTIDQTLCETFEKFLTQNTKPLKLFLTDGIDTTTLWCYLDLFTKNYEIVDYEYVKYTDFWRKSKQIAKANFWGYRFIHMWEDPTVLITGALGDEFFLRGPATMFILPTKHGIDIKNTIIPADYMYTYVMHTIDDYMPNTLDVLSRIDTVAEIKQYMYNILSNDHQHWHLDNTLTFTPFKDLTILETIMSADPSLLAQQAKHAEINRQLICLHDPDKLNTISPQKNNGMKNI